MIDAVLAAERTRAAALVARDVEALAACLHPELVYVHATGTRHDRDQLLHFAMHGQRFLAVTLGEPQIVCRGDAAIVVGTLELLLQRPGESAPTTARSWASAVWWRDPGNDARWRLRLFQSTRIAVA